MAGRPLSVNLDARGTLVAEADGWWRTQGAESRLSLVASTHPHIPGWYALSFDVVDATALLHPVVEVTGGESGSDIVEYQLPTVLRGPLSVVIHIDQPFTEISFAPSADAALFKLASVRIERMGFVALALSAMRRNPRKAAEAAVARMRGKRLRASNRLRAIFAPIPGTDYSAWAMRREREWAQEARGLRAEAERWPRRPGFDVTMPLSPGLSAPELERARETARSLAAQSHTRWRLDVTGDDAALAALAGEWPFTDPRISLAPAGGGGLASAGDWLILARPGDRLVADALLRMAERAVAAPETALIYGDDDRIDSHGRRRAPRFKPDYDADLFCAVDYLSGPALAVRRDLAGTIAACEGAGLLDLALTLAADGAMPPVAHIPVVLAHLADSRDGAAAVAARQAHLERRLAGRATVGEADGVLRLRWAAPEPAPPVSVIVCTRDRLDLLRPCIEGLRHDTRYPALEIVIADNDSREADTLGYFAALSSDPRVRIVPCPGPFNFAAINNRAAAAASGAYLLFLNNDVEVTHPDWLEEMAAQAARPGVGAVGARLLYPDGLIQHAGVVIGIGELAGHIHRFFPADHPGYMRRLQAVQRFSAVTAACLCVRRDHFEAVGGFDAALFPVAFNDVDLCLKIQALGLANLYTPHATLLHKESASRAKDFSPERLEKWRLECGHLQARWPELIARDPWYNPNLTRATEDWSLK